MSIEVIGRIISNASLAILVVFLHYVMKEKVHSPGGKTRGTLLGVGFAVAAVLSILMAVPVADGVILDSKTMLGVLAGFYGGWLPGLILSVAAAGARTAVGGMGAFGGSLGVVLGVGVGLLLRARRARGCRECRLPTLLALGVSAALIQVLMVATLLLYTEQSEVMLILPLVAAPTLSLYPPLTVIIGLMFGFVDDRASAHEELAVAQDELELMNATLAERVAARTAELERANAELRSTVSNLERTRDELVNSRKMATLGRLMAGIAHELNSPLGAVSGANRVLHDTILVQTPHLMELCPRLSAAEIDSMVCLLHRALQAPPLEEGLMTRRERHTALEATTQALAERHRWAAETVREYRLLGCTEELEQALDSPHAREILQVVTAFGMAMRSTVIVSLGAEKAARTVRALHNYTHQNHSAEPERICLAQELETVLELLHSEIHRGVRLTKEYQDKICIHGMRDPLNQVWMNLIKNALHAMEYRGELTLSVTYADTPQEVCVRVSDTGHGIPEHIRPQLFDAFFTTKADGEGIGIGLDICKQIIERHNGRIEYESGPAGSTFCVYLPAAQAIETHGEGT